MSEPSADELRDIADRIAADLITKGKCPWNLLKLGQSITHCPLGFPGCNCADELLLNPYLQKDQPTPPC